MAEHPLDVVVALGEQQGQDGDGADVGSGDGDLDDLADQQVHQTHQQHDGGSLADAAAHVAPEQLQPALLRHQALVHIGQGGGGGDDVDGVGQSGGILEAGLDPGGHGHGPGHHERTAGQSGVDHVAAQTAEEHLDQHDGEGSADDDLPVGHGDGADEGQQNTGDAGGQVIGLVVLLHQDVPQLLKQEAGNDGNGSDRQGAEAEVPHGEDQRGGQGDQDIAHDGLGGDILVHVGGAGNRQLIVVFHLIKEK